MLETHPFPAFIPTKVKYLILGSFTANSLKIDKAYDWYYGTKRNQFWWLIENTYKVKLENITEKKNLLRNLKMGITDIIYSCERIENNSLDSNLVNIVYNPVLPKLLSSKKLETIYFSSKYVEKLFKKVFKDIIIKYPDIKFITLPSPSPRYALLSKFDKVKIYKKILPKLNNE